MPEPPADAAPAAPPERIRRLPSWLITHLAGRANRLVAARFGRPGMRTAYALLASLAQSGPASQAELGRRLAIDRSDMVAMLNRLEAEGLAERRADPTDRRRNEITITGPGRRLLTTLDAQVDAAQDDLLAPLTQPEREQLVELLQRLLDHHHAGGRDATGVERPGRPTASERPGRA